MPTDSTLIAEIRALEERLLESYVRRSAADLDDLLAPEFREFGSSGRIFDKRGIIDLLAGQPEHELALADFGAEALSDGWVLATYRAAARRAGSAAVSHSLRSSLWHRREGRWQVVFHQGTRIPDSPSPGAAAEPVPPRR